MSSKILKIHKKGYIWTFGCKSLYLCDNFSLLKVAAAGGFSKQKNKKSLERALSSSDHQFAFMSLRRAQYHKCINSVSNYSVTLN